MTRGTTPTHTFKIPIHSSLVKSVMVIYAQNDKEVFHKDKWDCTMKGNEISVTLAQEETLKFDHRQNVQVQLRILTVDDVAMASLVSVISVKQCLNDEVL
jgi:hypothetical protein